MITETITINEQIKLIRQRAGMTQTELAEKSGLTQVSVSRIESGKYLPPIETINQLLAVMGKRARLVIEDL